MFNTVCILVLGNCEYCGTGLTIFHCIQDYVCTCSDEDMVSLSSARSFSGISDDFDDLEDDGSDHMGSREDLGHSFDSPRPPSPYVSMCAHTHMQHTHATHTHNTHTHMYVCRYIHMYIRTLIDALHIIPCSDSTAQ